MTSFHVLIGRQVAAAAARLFPSVPRHLRDVVASSSGTDARGEARPAPAQPPGSGTRSADTPAAPVGGPLPGPTSTDHLVLLAIELGLRPTPWQIGWLCALDKELR